MLILKSRYFFLRDVLKVISFFNSFSVIYNETCETLSNNTNNFLSVLNVVMEMKVKST